MENKLIVSINGTQLPVKEYQGQRVVTMKEIDAVHQRPEGTARKRFNDNKRHFIEGVDYFVRNSDEALSEYGIIAPNGLTLITENGYLMLVKSFGDDLAWTVQRQLVNVYFRTTLEQRREAAKKTPVSPMEYLRLVSQATFELDDRVTNLEDKVENQITLDYGQQRQLQRAVGERAYERAAEVFPASEIKASVGPFFRAIYKDLKDRFGVPSYRDIRGADYAAAVAYVGAWIEPAELRQREAG